MKRSLPAKIAVVCSSLILGCTYVSSQNNSHPGTPAPTTTQSARDRTAPSSPPVVTVKQRTILPSSKSIDSILSAPKAADGETNQDAPAPASPDGQNVSNVRTLMPGSKSGAIFKEDQKDPFAPK